MRNILPIAILLLTLFLYSCTDLLYSAKIGSIDGIKKSLENGMSIDHKNDQGRTALIIAAYSKHAEAVEYLCKMGADVNAKDNNSCTALLYASYYNILDVAEVLLKYNADKNIKDMYGNTPIDYAEMYNYDEMMTLFRDGPHSY